MKSVAGLVHPGRGPKGSWGKTTAAVFLIAATTKEAAMREEPKPQAKTKKLDTKMFWAALITVILIFGWIFVRPVAVKHSCSNKAKKISALGDVEGEQGLHFYDTKQYDFAYQQCLHGYGQ